MAKSNIDFSWIFYKRLLSFMSPYKRFLCLALFLSLLFSLVNLLFIPLVKDITTAISNRNVTHFNNYVFNALVLYFFRLAAIQGNYYLVNYLGDRICIDIRCLIFSKLVYLSSGYHVKVNLGDSMTRLLSDTTKAKDGTSILFFELLPQTLSLVAIVGMLCKLNWRLTLFSLVMAPVFVLFMSWISIRLKKLTYHVQKKTAVITQIIQETLLHLDVIHAYNLATRNLRRFEFEQLKQMRSNLYTIRLRLLGEGFTSYMQFVVIILVVWFGGYEMTRGHLTGPDLTAFFTGVLMLTDPIMSLSKVYNQVQQTSVSFQRIVDVLDRVDPSPVVSGECQSDIKGDIALSDVSFSYEQDSSVVLDTISVAINAGDVLALVGPSGAGKSTFIKLLLRFYDAQKGCILIDDRPIQDYDLLHLRRQLAFVSQENVVFDGTILENIRIGRLEASTKEVLEAAKAANAWEFIEQMPGKLLANVGDRGSNLSGGQRQRLSIARAILRDPRILILDEATSALDSESERLVQEALSRLMKGRTTVVVAHRLSTIMHATKIAVLEQGKVKELGSHDTLLAQKGLYHHLYKMQFHSDS